MTYTCQSCGVAVPRGLATVRTSLSSDVMPRLVSLAWCRTCRPVAAVPVQRRRVVETERIGA